ncbi:Gtr1/RagA G protein conserved region [Paramecium bursaria]
MEYQYKVIILGDIRTGKTSILQMSHDSTFNEAQQITIGINLIISQRKIMGYQIKKVYQYDIGGGSGFMIQVQNFIKRMESAIIVYDVTNPDGLASVQRWLNFIGESQTDLSIVIVANKVDKINERVISTKKGIKFAKQHGLQYYETSAKDKQSVDLMFESALYQLITHRYSQLYDQTQLRQSQKEINENNLLLQSMRNYQKSIKINMAFLVVLLFLVIFTVTINIIKVKFHKLNQYYQFIRCVKELYYQYCWGNIYFDLFDFYTLLRVYFETIMMILYSITAYKVHPKHQPYNLINGFFCARLMEYLLFLRVEESFKLLAELSSIQATEQIKVKHQLDREHNALNQDFTKHQFLKIKTYTME